MTENKLNSYELPEIPYGPIDALNRRAAAIGSPGYAQRAAHADYNGHSVSVAWNDYRSYYTAEYYWADRIVLARGSFATCLDAATQYYNKGALGASVRIAPREDDVEALAIIAADCRIIPAADADRGWYGWAHRCAARSVRDYCFPGAFVLQFDWELMQAAENEDDYMAALKTKYGRAYC